MQYDTVSVRAVIFNGNSILVEWCESKRIAFLPGGRREEGEDLRTTLTRELAEEIAGAQSEVGRYLGSIGHIWRSEEGTGSCLNHFFEARMIENSPVSAREPLRQIRWLSIYSDDLRYLKPSSLIPLLKAWEMQREWTTEWNIHESEV